MTITVKVKGDIVDEPDEVFFLNLLTATNAGIQDPTGGGLIIDDDPAPPAATRGHGERHGPDTQGAPFATVPLPCDVLAPGQSVNVVLPFSNPTRTPFTFSSSILAVVETPHRQHTVRANEHAASPRNTAPAGMLMGRNADHEHRERRASNRSERQYQQAPFPSPPPHPNLGATCERTEAQGRQALPPPGGKGQYVAGGLAEATRQTQRDAAATSHGSPATGQSHRGSRRGTDTMIDWDRPPARPSTTPPQRDRRDVAVTHTDALIDWHGTLQYPGLPVEIPELSNARTKAGRHALQGSQRSIVWEGSPRLRQ